MSKSSDFSALIELLNSWNLSELVNHFEDEDINIDELKLMKRHHIAELLQHFKMGLRVRFEHHFELWRRNINKPLSGFDKYMMISSPPIHTEANTEPETKRICCETRATNTDYIELVSSPSVCTTPLPLSPTSPTPTPLELLEEMPKLMPNPTRLSELAEKRSYSKRAASLPSNSGLTLIRKVYVKKNGNKSLSEAQKITHETYHVPPVSLMHIIKESGVRGAALMEYYRVNQSFTNSHRAQLITLIVNFFENNEYHLSLNLSHNLEKQILNLFPNEILSDYRTEKRGKIYVKFSNLKRYKRDRPTAKRKWEGGIAMRPASTLETTIDQAEPQQDDEDLAISFEGWADQTAEELVDVQVKTEYMSEEGY